jgi:hypothetical protein
LRQLAQANDVTAITELRCDIATKLRLLTAMFGTQQHDLRLRGLGAQTGDPQDDRLKQIGPFAHGLVFRQVQDNRYVPHMSAHFILFCNTKKALIMTVNVRVAFIGAIFEALDVGDVDVPTPVADQSCRLERARNDR